MSVQDSSRTDALGALVDSVVGRAPLNKLPLLLADKLEEEFLRNGWPEGLSLGAEQALASRYGVGRDVLREVVRLLEARDHVRMRRGPHGGLEVVRPDLDGLAARLAGYAYVSQLGRTQVLDAWLVLQAAAVRLVGPESAATALRSLQGSTPRARGNELIRSAGSTLLATLADMIGDLLPSIVDRHIEMPDLDLIGSELEFGTMRGRREALVGRPDSEMEEGAFVAPLAPRASCFQHQAMHLVHDLMNTISPEAWASGELIGNEFDLADRFGVDKSIVRQAIRLMEDAETATALPGRGRGLVTRLPSTAPLGRLLCAFLVSHDIAISDGEQVFEALRIESTGVACERVTPEDRATLMAMADDLDLLRAPLPVAAIQAFERLQQHVAYNRLLSLFVDGVKAFLTWRSEPFPLASDPIVDSYRTHTKQVVAAICAGDGEAARRAEAAKLAALRAGRTAQNTILRARSAA